MATTVIDLKDQQTTVLQLRLDVVRAEGRVQPRLIFDFQGETKGTHVHAEIHALRVEVSSNGEYLGTGTQRNVVTDVFGYGSQVRIGVPITRAVIEYIDERLRGATDVQLRLEVQAYLRLRTETPAPLGQASPEPSPWHEVTVWPIQAELTVPRSDWIARVVQPLGLDQYVFLEITIPPVPERGRWEQALAHLAEAEQHYREGNDPEVLQRCYAAFEALDGAPKAIFDALPDIDKRDQLNAALRAAKEYMHSGRHVSKAGELEGTYPVDHRDAAFALGQAKLWLSYISRLLAHA
jgi:hypothetical protein